MDEVARLVLELHRRQRDGVLALHVGEDRDVGVEQAAVAQRVVGVGLHDALIGHDGAGVDVDADEAGRRRRRRWPAPRGDRS